MDYDVRLEVRRPEGVNENQIDELFDELEGDLDGLVINESLRDDTISLSYGVKASNATGAIDAGLTKLERVLGVSTELIGTEAKPYEDPARRELVTQAEIARRLGVSREWVSRLAKQGELPKPQQPSGARAGLYLWGDIEEWQRQRKLKTRVSRSPAKRGERVYA